MARATIIRKIQVVGASEPEGTVLAQAAASLAPGQSVRLATTLPGSTLIFSGETSPFIVWGSSGYYDPTRKEVGFIGKRSGPNQYHWLVYDEEANTWSNSRPLWDSNDYYGHGYDHNTIDPATGTVYFRPFNEKVVHVWDGSWSALSAWSQNTKAAGGLSWFPGVGLIYSDGAFVIRYSGGSWSTVSALGGDSYHDFSEYNSTANVLIFGSGNGSALRRMTSALSVSTVASPPFNIGAAHEQGVCISDPSSAKLVAYQKGTTNWAEYDITEDDWSSLSQCSGDGSTPASGTPNLTGNLNQPVIGIPIPEYGMMMFIQHKGSSTPAEVWLYRHS